MVVFHVWGCVCVCAHPRQRQPKKGGSKGLLEGLNYALQNRWNTDPEGHALTPMGVKSCQQSRGTETIKFRIVIKYVCKLS